MGTKTSLTLIAAIFGFTYGLVLGVSVREWGLSGGDVVTATLLLVMPNIVVVLLCVMTLLRGISAPPLVCAMLGAILWASVVLGDFFIVVLIGSLPEYGGRDDTWNEMLGFGLQFSIMVGAFIGFLNVVAIALVAHTLSWLSQVFSKMRSMHRRHLPV